MFFCKQFVGLCIVVHIFYRKTARASSFNCTHYLVFMFFLHTHLGWVLLKISLEIQVKNERLHMFGLHECDHGLKTPLRHSWRESILTYFIKSRTARPISEKKGNSSFARESNRWSFSFPTWNPHTTKGLRFNSGLGTGIFSPFFGLQHSAVFLF